MKKIALMGFLLFIVSGCGNGEKSVTCKMDTQSDVAGAEVTYVYNDKDKIIKIKNESFLSFSKEELKEASLDDYYKEFESLYKDAKKEDGVKITLTKDEKKNSITMNSEVDLEKYDLDKDILSVSSEGNLDDVKEVVELKKALGYYDCGSIK